MYAQQSEDLEMTQGAKGLDSKSSNSLAPKRVWQGDTMSSWYGDSDAQAGEEVPDGLKENYYKEDVTILKSVDLKSIKLNRRNQ